MIYNNIILCLYYRKDYNIIYNTLYKFLSLVQAVADVWVGSGPDKFYFCANESKISSGSRCSDYIYINILNAQRSALAREGDDTHTYTHTEHSKYN